MGQPVVHFEVLGKDAEKTQSYYSQLFGWEIEPLPFENPTQDGLVQREGTRPPRASASAAASGAPEGYDGHVTFYVGVPDVDARWRRPRASAARA